MNNRVEKLRAYLNDQKLDALLITSSSNRRYMTGFTGSSGVALVTLSEAIFITDFRYTDQAAEQAKGYSIVQHSGPITEQIHEELKRLQVKRLGFEQNFVTFATYRGYEQLFNGVELVPVANAIETLRMVKDESEVEQIKKAIEISDAAYTHILKFIKTGMREIEVANELEFFMRKQGASSSSFSMIVASGVRSAMPHGVASEKVIEAGDFVTLDFGAVYQGYISDMTRTFSMGEPPAELRKIYDIVLEAQLKGVSEIKAGLSGIEADAICRDYIKSHGYGDQFGHSTGHGIGLDVHEGPGLSFKSDVILQPGMVVTVEPGIYISGLGGVRIEDNILITQDGNQNLTKSTKEFIIIE